MRVQKKSVRAQLWEFCWGLPAHLLLSTVAGRRVDPAEVGSRLEHMPGVPGRPSDPILS